IRDGAPCAQPKKPPTVRQGVYAADDDDVEAWVSSFDAGCISSHGGGNNYTQVEFITGAQYRMLRTLNGDAGITRSMLRRYRAEMPNYKGHVLWMNTPMNVGRGGQGATQEMNVLAFEHGIRKAMAMGVPFMFDGSQYGAQAAQALGLKVQQTAVKLLVDRGN